VGGKENETTGGRTKGKGKERGKVNEKGGILCSCDFSLGKSLLD